MRFLNIWIAVASGAFLVAAGYAMRGEHGPTGHVGYLGTDFAGVQGGGPTRGLLGVSPGVGAQGESSDTGVLGFGTGPGDLVNGVAGVISDPAGAGAGVYGAAPLTGWAGFFDGDLGVNGTIYKSSGAFRIDHPLDPANRYLSHSFVESPDMKNIYDGVATLDRNGEATIELPPYFEALNENFRYQVTCIGEHAPVFIAQKIVENKFRIAGGYEGMEVSWQVTGSRHDAYAAAHPIVTEELKPITERGRFIHPELFNAPVSAGVDFERSIAVHRMRQQTHSKIGKTP